MDSSPPCSSVHGDSPGKDTRVVAKVSSRGSSISYSDIILLFESFSGSHQHTANLEVVIIAISPYLSRLEVLTKLVLALSPVSHFPSQCSATVTVGQDHYCYLTNIKCVLVSSNLSDSTPEVYPETLSPRFPCRNSCLGSNSLESDLEIIPMKMIY